jgi:branched-chain amino acid transport system ATP-binding protein
MLEAVGIEVRFQGLAALSSVDLALERDEILGLIGPNGAGKTTLVNVLSGFQPVRHGRIMLDGADVSGFSPPRLARMGLVRTFQNTRVFARLTALENVEAGAIGVGMNRAKARHLAWDLLERMNLADRAYERAESLPYGDEKRLGILRAVAARPKFLLLDEPAAGLNEIERIDLMKAIGLMRAEIGCGLMVIEHDTQLILQFCQRVQVLDYGKSISVGTPEQIQKDPAVIAAYLGKEAGTDGTATQN